MTRRGAVTWLASGSGLLLGGCGLLRSRANYRFRMTIEVSTSSGVRTGSSVMEIESYKEAIVVGDRGGGHTGLTGQAVVIDLPDGPIFALLTIGDGARGLAGVVTEALAPDARTVNFDHFLTAVRRLGSGRYQADLPRLRSPDATNVAGEGEPNWPMMVRFASIADPQSVEAVDPYRLGVRRVTLETTDAPLSVGIEKRLPWLTTQSGSLVRVPAGETPERMPFGYLITQREFSTEIKHVEKS